MRKFRVRLKSGERLEFEASDIRSRRVEGTDAVEFLADGQPVAYFLLSDVAAYIDHEAVRSVGDEEHVD